MRRTGNDHFAHTRGGDPTGEKSWAKGVGSLGSTPHAKENLGGGKRASKKR